MNTPQKITGKCPYLSAIRPEGIEIAVTIPGMTVSKMLAFIKPKSQISVKKSKRTNQWEKKVDAIVKAKREVNLYLRLLKSGNGICGSSLIFDRRNTISVKKSEISTVPRKFLESQPHSSAFDKEKTRKPTAKTASVESTKSISLLLFLPGISASFQERNEAKMAIGIC